jgi:hypothetical protein
MTRTPDNILNCVVFLGARTDRGLIYGGTAFYVAATQEGDDSSDYVYLVTAKHNLTMAVEHSKDGKILIRPNWRDPNKTAPIETTRKQWVDHDDADVSILDIQLEELAYSAVADSMILTDETRDGDGIGIGDELQIIGLFVQHRGINRNVPIVRTGTIAAMPDPDELVDTGLGPMEAYLAEVRSLGGLSGSPVFVVVPPGRIKRSAPYTHFATHLLGVIHGHWDVDVSETDYAAGTEKEKINQGIAVVVPSAKILELINAPKEQARRKASWEDMEKKRRRKDG